MYNTVIDTHFNQLVEVGSYSEVQSKVFDLATDSHARMSHWAWKGKIGGDFEFVQQKLKEIIRLTRK